MASVFSRRHLVRIAIATLLTSASRRRLLGRSDFTPNGIANGDNFNRFKVTKTDLSWRPIRNLLDRSNSTKGETFHD
jgi:hypothetical protein